MVIAGVVPEAGGMGNQGGGDGGLPLRLPPTVRVVPRRDKARWDRALAGLSELQVGAMTRYLADNAANVAA